MTATVTRQPDYRQFEAVLNRCPSDRPVLFELFHDRSFYIKSAGTPPSANEIDAYARWHIRAWAAMGYDFINVYASDLRFPAKPRESRGGGQSLNEGFVITDWESFEAYQWPDPDLSNDQYFHSVLRQLPAGMKANVFSYGGVLENVVQLTGFDNACVMMYEQPELIGAVFQKVGGILTRYYQKTAPIHGVGALIASDDWGHKTQTLLTPAQLRQYVFPHYEAINDTACAYRKYTVLHSCGNLAAVMDDIIDGLHFDAKHSFEDVIQPVEEAYALYGRRIAVLGGIDVHFLCRSSVRDIQRRAGALLKQTKSAGGYALGTGNSAVSYIPYSHYIALIRTAWETGTARQ